MAYLGVGTKTITDMTDYESVPVIAVTAPANPAQDQLWLDVSDPDNPVGKRWNGSAWVAENTGNAQWQGIIAQWQNSRTVSNFNAQIELLQKYVGQKLQANQLQLSLAASNMIAQGLEVNMETAGSVGHDGSVLDYCRLHDITVQAWSPFQKPAWRGTFVGDYEEYGELNKVMDELAEKYAVTPTGIAAAWILRHPAGMQVVTGTSKESRLKEIFAGAEVRLTREEWYRLYLAAGHILP